MLSWDVPTYTEAEQHEHGRMLQRLKCIILTTSILYVNAGVLWLSADSRCFYMIYFSRSESQKNSVNDRHLSNPFPLEKEEATPMSWKLLMQLLGSQTPFIKVFVLISQCFYLMSVIHRLHYNANLYLRSSTEARTTVTISRYCFCCRILVLAYVDY